MGNKFDRPPLKRLLLQPYQRDASKVGRGRDHWEMVTGQAGAGYDHFVAEILKRQHQLDLLPLALGTSGMSADPVAAYVDNNRWGARCECGGFEVLDPLDPRFYCGSCHNVVQGGKPRPVVFPAKAVLAQIERALKARPDPSTRTWYEFETVADLKGENVANGLPEEVA